MIAFILFLAVLSQSCGWIKKEVFIIPKNYTGCLIVFFDQANSAPVKVKNRERIFEIPSNGVLVTSSSINTDWLDFPEFYYERIDPANQVPYKTNPKEIPVNGPAASGGLSCVTQRSPSDTTELRCMVYFIGNKKQTSFYYNEFQKMDMVKMLDQQFIK